MTTHSETSQVRGSTRDKLLKAARHLLAEKGFEATTVSEIVARAGVAQGTFYLYFQSKTSIIAELYREMWTGVQDAVGRRTEGAASFSEALVAGVRAVYDEIAKYEDVLPVIAPYIYESAAMEKAHEEPYYALISAWIERGQAGGELDPEVDPERTARLIVGLIEQVSKECFIFNPGTPIEPYIDEIIRFVQRALERR